MDYFVSPRGRMVSQCRQAMAFGYVPGPAALCHVSPDRRGKQAGNWRVSQRQL